MLLLNNQSSKTLLRTQAAVVACAMGLATPGCADKDAAIASDPEQTEHRDTTAATTGAVDTDGSSNDDPRTVPSDAAHELAAADAGGSAGSRDSATPSAPTVSPSGAAGASPNAASDESQRPAMPERPWPTDCEYRRVFRAHGKSQVGDTSKYRIAPDSQFMVNFYFDSPWQEDVQLLAARPLVDNRSVVHHWVLWLTRKTRSRDGEIVGGPEQFATTADPIVAPLIAAGVGSSDLEMPEGVGLRVGTADEIQFMFDVHYVTLGRDEAAEDASGVEVCLTSKKRPAEAALHELGKLSFDLPAHEVTSIATHCVPRSMAEPVHIAAITPHMHVTGTRAKLVLNRRSGKQVVLHDQPYLFAEQRTYMLANMNEAVLEPGDSLTTTCTFDNTTDQRIAGGEKNDDEMCRLFAIAWPIGGLSNGLPAGFLVGQPTELSCLEF